MQDLKADPIIKIGDQTITAAEAVSLMARYRLIPQLAREVIMDRAIATIAYSEKELEQATEQFFQQQQAISEADRQNWLRSQGMTMEQVRQTVLRQLKIEKYKQVTWDNKLQSYFLKRKGRLDRVIYSLLRVKDAGTAQELYFRLVDDQQAFDELARAYSQGPEAETGGLLGPVTLATPHPALARMLSVSQPGQLWPPTPLGEWFIIVRLEKFLPAQLDDAMRKQLLDELFTAWLQEQLQQVSITTADADADTGASAIAPPDPTSSPTEIPAQPLVKPSPPADSNGNTSDSSQMVQSQSATPNADLNDPWTDQPTKQSEPSTL